MIKNKEMAMDLLKLNREASEKSYHYYENLVKKDE